MWIVNNKRIFYTISGVALVLSIIFIVIFGLRLSIDFTGGSVLEFEYQGERPDISEVREDIDNLEFDSYVLRGTGEKGYILKLSEITDEEKNQIIEAVSGDSEVVVNRFNTIGPTLGNELQTKATVSLLVVVIAIILFIAFSFRQVSKPVSSWKYGFVAIIALIHDVVITLGVFALLGRFLGVEIDTLFITALLVILGYSINDTIVVLDRVRENLRDMNDKQRNARFTEIVGKSLKETFARSINTSITTLLALLALLFIGGEATRFFALALVVGVISGAYSSLFLAAPMLVSFKERGDRKG